MPPPAPPQPPASTDPAPGAGRRGVGVLAVAAGVVVLVVLGAVLVSLRSGGDETTSEAPATAVSTTQVTRDGVTVAVPAGWAISDPGDPTLVVAAHTEDLSFGAPQGPRMTVRRASTERRDPQDVAAALRSPGSAIDVVEEPVEVTVGDVPGVSVTLREVDDGTPVIRSYVVVNVDGTNVYLFVLEAGEDVWDDQRGTLHTILASAVFETNAAAPEPTTTVAAEPTATTATTSTPTTTAPATTQPTTTTGPGGGFATPEEAIYAAFGYEGSPIMSCNSAESGALNPCYDRYRYGVFVYLFRPHYGEWHWVLVEEYGDGTFTVADTVEEAGEYEFPNVPWDE